MDNTLLRIENKAKDTVKLISLLRNNGVDVAEVEEAIQQVRSAAGIVNGATTLGITTFSIRILGKTSLSMKINKMRHLA